MMAEADAPGLLPRAAVVKPTRPPPSRHPYDCPQDGSERGGRPKVFARLTVECSQNEAADSRDDLVASGAGHSVRSCPSNRIRSCARRRTALRRPLAEHIAGFYLPAIHATILRQPQRSHLASD